MKRKQLAIGALAIAAASLAYFAPTQADNYNYQNLLDEGNLVAYDREGGIYFAVTGTSTSNGKNMILVKYSASLVKQWDVAYDGPAHGDDVATGLAVDSRGVVFVSGTSYGGTGTGNDVAVKGWLSDGSPLWSGSNFHDGAVRWNSSGPAGDNATDLACDRNGNLYVSGYTVNTGFVVGFESDGDLKTGWPNYFVGSGSPVSAYHSVAVADDLSVIAAGAYQPSISDDSEFLVDRWQGGGSLADSDHTDTSSGNDFARDCTFVPGSGWAIAGSSNSNGAERFAVLSYNGSGHMWTRTLTVASSAYAVAAGDGFVFATGESVPGESGIVCTTLKLDADDGDLSTTWASSSGVPAGTRYSSYGIETHGYAIWKAGTNVYIAGERVFTDTFTNPKSKYIAHCYSAAGAEGLTEQFPSVTGSSDSRANAITVFCAGHAFETGLSYDTANVGGDAGNLWYSRSPSSTAPTVNPYLTIGTGTITYGQIATSDNTHGVATADLISGDYDFPVTLLVYGTPGTGKSELCVEIESKAQYPGIKQHVDFYNFDSSEFEEMDSRYITTADTTVHVAIKDDPDPYINGSGNVTVRLRYAAVGLDQDSWTVSIDKVGWKHLN